MARTKRPEKELEFGRRLRVVLRRGRESSGRSARDVAKAVDLSVDNIYAMERGDVLSPGFWTVHVLAREYGLDLATIAREADDQATS